MIINKITEENIELLIQNRIEQVKSKKNLLTKDEEKNLRIQLRMSFQKLLHLYDNSNVCFYINDEQ